MGAFEEDVEQVAGSGCELEGADARNPTEHIVIPAAQLAGAIAVRVRVLGSRVQGIGLTSRTVWPDYVAGDGDGFDIIDDTLQGYALVASGQLATQVPRISFDDGILQCGGTVGVVLWDCDAPGTVEVEVRSAAGDCERLTLAHDSADPAFVLRSEPLPLIDPKLGAPNECDLSDGVLIAPDDELIRATYSDLGSWGSRTVGATARVHCRDVELVEATLTGTCPAMPAALVAAGHATILVRLANAAALGSTALWGRLVPEDVDVTVVGEGAVFEPLLDGVGSESIARFDVEVASTDVADSATVRFRVELMGENGFRDRVLFELSRVAGPVSTAVRPGEVPSGLNGPPMLVTKLGTTDPNGVASCRISWSAATSATAYNVWQGTLAALSSGLYDHAIESGQFFDCNIVPPPLSLTTTLSPGRVAQAITTSWCPQRPPARARFWRARWATGIEIAIRRPWMANPYPWVLLGSPHVYLETRGFVPSLALSLCPVPAGASASHCRCGIEFLCGPGNR